MILKKQLDYKIITFIGLIFTSSLMLKGYTFYDEIFLLGIVLLFIISSKIKIIFLRLKKIKLSLIEIIFLFVMFYLLFQSFRGFLIFFNLGEFNEIRKIRWILFFLLIIFIFFIFKINREEVTKKDYNSYIAYSGFIFSILYFLISVIYLKLFGVKYYYEYANFKYGFMSTSAYCAAILSLTFPSIINNILNSSKNYKFQNLNIFILIFYFILFLYLSSRLGIILWLLFFTFLIFSLFKKYQKKFFNKIFKYFLLFLFLVFVSFLFIILLDELTHIETKHKVINIYDSFSIFATKNGIYRLRDLDRILLNYIPLVHIYENFNLFNFLFGHGLRTGSFVISMTQHEILNQYGIFSSYTDNPGTTAFAHILIETGIVGFVSILILSMSNFIILNKLKYPIFISVIPLIFLTSIFIINSFDIILFYIILIPNFLKDIFKVNKKKFKLGKI